MLSVRRCTVCHRLWKRSECPVEPEGLFGPELLCPSCGAITESRLTPLGWTVALVWAIVLGVAVILLTRGSA